MARTRGLETTTIGSYPKPEYLNISDWFSVPQGPDTSSPTARYESEIETLGENAEALFQRAAKEVIADQIGAGVDVVTDGEVRRENYIHYHCRHLQGISFRETEEKVLREGSYRASLPVIQAKIEASEAFLVSDWKAAQDCSAHPVKVTLPGPMTISDTVVNKHYDDEVTLGKDLASALNVEVKRLADAGCRYIQIDEPLFARRPEPALAFGIENLERCFHGIGADTRRVSHMCCGYPDRLDNPDYPKAPPSSYFALAEALDDSVLDAVSLEDAHRHNDLALLERFAKTEVIFGSVAIAKSHIESVDEIETRLRSALNHIDPERLGVAPDCGLGMLPRETARAKLSNMCEAVQRIKDS